ncbi:MAG: biotin synthase BioB [Eubacteriales bacterium]|nr:biotin synthase BioB [Eubacteriales bacterium]
MIELNELKEKVLKGEYLSKEELLSLCEVPLDVLSIAADEIREHFCGNQFDICTIINGKCGKCSEDCKYCAQSCHYNVDLKECHSLLQTEEIVAQAQKDYDAGVLRYSIVTSGRRLSKQEVLQVCESIGAIRSQVGIEVCVSFGLLDEEDFRQLREAGVSRVHCNLETSKSHFSSVCTTHTYEEKLDTIRAAQRAGLQVCSGGIMGIEETMEDRIDMILDIRALGIKSVPVNVLNAIPGTPYEHNKVLTRDEVRRIIAIYRFAIPDAFLRMAGGRGLLGDKGESCFTGGANAAISGDMLTTAGISIETDRELVQQLGYEIR